MLWTHLTRLQSVGYGGGGVQWEVDGMESGGGRAWVGLSPFMSPEIGMWVPIIGTGQKQEEQRGLLPSSHTSIPVVHPAWFHIAKGLLYQAFFFFLVLSLTNPFKHPKSYRSEESPNCRLFTHFLTFVHSLKTIHACPLLSQLPVLCPTAQCS